MPNTKTRSFTWIHRRGVQQQAGYLSWIELYLGLIRTKECQTLKNKTINNILLRESKTMFIAQEISTNHHSEMKFLKMKLMMMSKELSIKRQSKVLLVKQQPNSIPSLQSIHLLSTKDTQMNTYKEKNLQHCMEK